MTAKRQTQLAIWHIWKLTTQCPTSPVFPDPGHEKKEYICECNIAKLKVFQDDEAISSLPERPGLQKPLQGRWPARLAQGSVRLRDWLWLQGGCAHAAL